MQALVSHVHLSSSHEFHKQPAASLRLHAGLGVEGDAHFGATVKHRSRVAADPSQPNLRQVHLLAGELFTELAAQGFQVAPGDLGENVTTTGLDLLALPTGSTLQLGDEALVCLTGLRNPCQQIENFRSGLLAQVARRGADGQIERRAGVMAVVIRSGTVSPGDRIDVALPAGEPRPLERV